MYIYIYMGTHIHSLNMCICTVQVPFVALLKEMLEPTRESTSFNRHLFAG